MAEQDPFEQFQKIPKHVRSALINDYALRANDIILTTYDIEGDQQTELFEIMREVMILELPVEQLPQVIQERMGMDEEVAKKIAIDVVGLRLLPIQDWLGDVRQYIPRWGGKSDKYVERLQKMYSLRFAHREIFDPIYSKHELGELTVEEFERLDNIIISYVNEKRTDKEMVEVLMRGKDKGGMGFDEGKAVGFLKDIKELIEEEALTQELVNEAKKKRDAVITAERIPGAEEIMRKDIEVPESVKGPKEVEDAIRDPEEAAQREALAEQSPVAPSYKGDVKSLEESMRRETPLPAPSTPLSLNLQEDEAEVSEIGARSGATKMDMESEEVESWVQAHAEQFGVPQELVSRWVGAGTTYLKDIKNDFEFQDVLTRPVEEGGLGLSEDMMKQAVKMMKEKKEIVMSGGKLEAQAEPVPSAETGPVPTPETRPKPEPAQEAPKPTFEIPAEPEQDYFKTPEAPSMQPQAAPMANTATQPPVATPPQPAPQPPKEEGPAEQPTAPVAPAPKPSHEEAQAIIKKKADALRAAKAKPKQTPEPEQPIQTKPKIIRPPETAPGKTPVVEIQPPAQKIVGPLDELRSMSLEIFRDLSVSPEEAKNILIEKINLFREQGIQRYTDAKLAWKASPLNQLMLEIGGQSFEEGRPIEQVLDNRQKAGKPSMELEEFNAITDLNREIEK